MRLPIGKNPLREIRRLDDAAQRVIQACVLLEWALRHRSGEHPAVASAGLGDLVREHSSLFPDLSDVFFALGIRNRLVHTTSDEVWQSPGTAEIARASRYLDGAAAKALRGLPRDIRRAGMGPSPIVSGAAWRRAFGLATLMAAVTLFTGWTPVRMFEGVSSVVEKVSYRRPLSPFRDLTGPVFAALTEEGKNLKFVSVDWIGEGHMVLRTTVYSKSDDGFHPSNHCAWEGTPSEETGQTGKVFRLRLAMEDFYWPRDKEARRANCNLDTAVWEEVTAHVMELTLKTDGIPKATRKFRLNDVAD